MNKIVKVNIKIKNLLTIHFKIWLQTSRTHALNLIKHYYRKLILNIIIVSFILKYFVINMFNVIPILGQKQYISKVNYLREIFIVIIVWHETT